MTTTASDRGVHGWLVIDKPPGITSARVVALVKRSCGAGKIGHAGTLDPLATGILPLALGEATKTVRFAASSRKRYRFRIRWGEARDTDDRPTVVCKSVGSCATDSIRRARNDNKLGHNAA